MLLAKVHIFPDQLTEHTDLIWDAPTMVGLRSVLMKPEHYAAVPALHQRIIQAVKSAQKQLASGPHNAIGPEQNRHQSDRDFVLHEHFWKMRNAKTPAQIPGKRSGSANLPVPRARDCRSIGFRPQWRRLMRVPPA